MLVERDTRKGKMIGKSEIAVSDEIEGAGICMAFRMTKSGMKYWFIYSYNADEEDKYVFQRDVGVNEAEAWERYTFLLAQMIRNLLDRECIWLIRTIE